jgi:malonate decarboxylase gamma subunit
MGVRGANMNDQLSSRGSRWFKALVGVSVPRDGDPDSVLLADAPLGTDTARFLAVVPNPHGRFPRARQGEVGLEEACALALGVREAIELDRNHYPRPLVAIVDVKSQAYGRREEMAAIYLAGALAVDAYATARMQGHPVIALIVGQAFSGALLTHGYQANRILAFDDPGVIVQAMHKKAAARIMRRSEADFDLLSSKIAPLSYAIRDFDSLGILHSLLHIEHPESPQPDEVELVRSALIQAIADSRQGPRDLSLRYTSPKAALSRQATLLVRKKLAEQWSEG